MQEISPFTQGFLHHRLSVQEKEIKGKYTDFDLHIFCLNVLSFPGHKLLEWQDLLVGSIPSDCFTVKNKALYSVFNPTVKFRQNIRVLLR